MYDEKASKETRETQVRVQMAILEKWTVQILEDANRLSNILKPVLSPMPNDESRDEVKEVSHLAPLAKELSSFSDRLAEANQIIRRLIDQNEL